MALTKQGHNDIEYVDYTLNPYPGCDFPCDYCFARAMAKRYNQPYNPRYRPADWAELEKIKSPSMILLPSAGEMLGPWVKPEHIQEGIDVMASYPQHTFLILTKNPIRFWEFEWPQNCWLGTTVDGTNFTKWNVVKLMKNLDFENKRFVSLEPMQAMPELDGFLASVDWLIIGGRTGKQPFRPPKAWIDDIIRFARENSIAVFIKSNASYPEEIQEWPDGIGMAGNMPKRT